MEARKARLVESYVYERAVDQDTYGKMLDKLHEEIALAQIDLHDAQLQKFDIEAVLRFAEQVVMNAALMWSKMSTDQKQRFQRILFPKCLTVSDNGEVRTVVTCQFFSTLQPENGCDSCLAAPTGFEPVYRD